MNTIPAPDITRKYQEPVKGGAGCVDWLRVDTVGGRLRARRRVVPWTLAAVATGLVAVLQPTSSTFTAVSPGSAEFVAATVDPVSGLAVSRQCAGASRGDVQVSWDTVTSPVTVSVTRDATAVTGAGPSGVLDTGLPATTAATYQVVATVAGWTSDTRTVAVAACSDRPLDLIASPPAVAYGLRQLRADHTGPLVRVRRAGDATETDIGLAGRELDTTALLAFCGAGTCTVTTWYDQSGNNRHATQTTASRQPALVTNGALVTARGRPTLRYTGNQALYAPGVALGTNQVTGNAIGAVFEEGDRLFGFTADGQTEDDNNALSAAFFSRRSDRDITVERNGFLGDLTDAQGTFVYSARFTGTALNLFRDGVAGTSDATSGPFGATGTVGLGTDLAFDSAVNDRLHGVLTEVTLFPAALPDTELQALETDQQGWLAGATPTAPGAPTAVATAVGRGWVDVTWTPPAPTNPSPFVSYTATATPGTHQCTTQQPEPLLGCSLTGLNPATQYTITVTATTLDATGPASTAVTATPTGTEYLANRGFETGSASGWDIRTDMITTDARTGAYTGVTVTTTEVRQQLTGLSPNTTYLLRAWARGNVATTTGVLFARSPGITEVTTVITGTTWQQYQLTFTTGPTETTATIGTRRTGGSGRVRLDDTSLTVVPT